MATIIHVPQEVEQEHQQVSVVLSERAEISVKSNDDYVAVGEWVKSLKEAKKKFIDKIKEPIEKAFATHRAFTKFRDEVVGPIDAKIEAGNRALVAYFELQEKIRKDAEERARKEAERIAAEQEAERKRLIADAEAQARKEAEDRQIAAAEAVAAMGDTAAAEEILNEPVVVEVENISAPPPVVQAPVVIPKTVPTVSGLSFKQDWDFEITNEDLIPREYMKVDEVKIRGVVRALKKATPIPGVRVFPRTTTTQRLK